MATVSVVEPLTGNRPFSTTSLFEGKLYANTGLDKGRQVQIFQFNPSAVELGLAARRARS
jgi:hypothetical protein